MTMERRPTVGIVGPCASGKSTLARNLMAHGFDARVSGQEHSEIRTLWQRLDADVVIALHIDLETLRERRGQTWSPSLYETQQRRLATAYAAADLTIDTAVLSEADALAVSLDYLRSLN